ncbi:transglutaminase family protein [Aestuariimicrobium ganziense]|uniref:transglutaminase family protein n=1 Tax=Aestuariimicrobium ganziense TaxID=2773677 RepID=UPI0019448FDD|nr:transglutaminase family protein [Aestuariimicrobium ganziense]
MSIRVALHHETTYRFARPVRVFPHVVRLRPAPHSRTRIEAYSLSVTPPDHFLNWQQDPFGNYLARLVFPQPTDELSFTVELVADMTAINPFDFFVEDYASTFPFTYPDALGRDLSPYLRRVGADEDGTAAAATARAGASAAAHPSDDAVDAWIEAHLRPTGVFDGGTRIVDFLVAVNQAIRSSINYTTRMEVGVQTPAETLAQQIGSCRDSAWLLVSVLRRCGIAARFVSGYLVQLASDDARDGGPAEDFTDLHAWAEAFIPGAGWIGLDATSGLLAGEGHIPLSATPEPESAAPITGATEVVEVSMSFVNEVRRIHEDPRVTKPYTDEQWAQVDALGAAVDERLIAGDVRLTMGGEPTFVTSGDTSHPQWESEADGAEKRELSARLAHLLVERWAPQGIVHHGQGKWYPGEELPRWQTQIAWRADGEPLWRRRDLLADPEAPATLPADDGERAAAVEHLAKAIAARLGISDEFVLAAHEDPVQSVLDEARLPLGERPGVDDDPASTVEAIEAAVADEPPAGWVVPVFVDPDGDGWATARWRTRRRAIFLTQGTSALGYRLPLDSVAWGEAPEITRNHEGDLTSDLPAAPERTAPQAREVGIDEAPRTAVAVQPRSGHAHVFLPPVDRLEDGLGLLAAIEQAAADANLPVVLEGYRLPDDPRLESISVTPDPGVIEVNVHPTKTWPQLRKLTTTLFEDAREAGLATEKFDLDGTHTGTGGGNHITLGGPTPADSPFLRRPDLLRSLVTYWQWHPGLSYLFTGKFIGSTSQAPRVDEGLAETLYDLEIAFAELEAMVDDPAINHDIEAVVREDWRTDEDPDERVARQRFTQPWLVDRLLRHLLTDLTGNTHRAEFCIDKLYSPDQRTGRLGLVEMRGFEMPAHARMSLVQAALVRALVARFWEEPIQGPLVRWGTRLHDRYLLPAFVAADLREVVAELNQHTSRWTQPDGGAAPRFDERWREPFLEFRFPRLGEVRIGDVSLELRQAIEPWQVLGEEVSLGGTARYVDSSVERVQVSAVGMTEGRHVLTCNGVPVPTVPIATTGWGVGRDATAGARVGGVRFRAWDPPSALHPTIGVHSPLHFDLVDVRNATSLGGFTYHVTHQGGLAYDRYPVNAVEAESRRTNRFEERRTSGKVDVSNWPQPHGLLGGEPSEFPVSLDLRRFSRGRHPAGGDGTDATPADGAPGAPEGER